MLEGLKIQLESHLNYVKNCRSTFAERAKFAWENKTQVFFINIGGMNQYKTGIPTVWTKAKGDDVGKPLTTKMLGAIVYGYGWYRYWNLLEWAASSNLTLTASCYTIRDISKFGPLFKKLHLQIDNIAKDNDNHCLLEFYAMLIAEHVFQEVVAFFLPIGHTH